jgi:hypothetical protein
MLYNKRSLQPFRLTRQSIGVSVVDAHYSNKATADATLLPDDDLLGTATAAFFIHRGKSTVLRWPKCPWNLISQSDYPDDTGQFPCETTKSLAQNLHLWR